MTTIRIDTSEAEGLAASLRSITGQMLRREALAAVNETAQRADGSSVERMTQRYNIGEAYLRNKIRLVRATDPAKPRAEIVALGPDSPQRAGLTILSNYDAKQMRGGASGRKPAGVEVEVRRGNRVQRTKWFMMALKGTDGKQGVFERDPARGGKPMHLYGPAPYSMLRQQGAYHADEFESDLAATMRRRTQALLESVL